MLLEVFADALDEFDAPRYCATKHAVSDNRNTGSSFTYSQKICQSGLRASNGIGSSSSSSPVTYVSDFDQNAVVSTYMAQLAVFSLLYNSTKALCKFATEAV